MSRTPRGKRVVAPTVALLGVMSALALTGCATTLPTPTPGVVAHRAAPSPTANPPTPAVPSSIGQSPTAQSPTAPPSTPLFDRSAYSTDDPSSIWVVVDKLRPLRPKSFVPPLVPVPVPHTNEPSMQPAAADAVVRMFAAARRDGLHLASNSAYRSYSTQVHVYDEDRAAHGVAAADASTARPGFSEHQTGLAIDIGAVSGRCSLDACFADTPEGRWLFDNAWQYGFLLRYPKDLTRITGYEWEPWHYRYVGDALAAELHRTGIRTLEQFFDLPPAPSYAK